MLPSEDKIENRLGPPGVNSRSFSAAYSASDLEVLREIDNVYFSSPSEFDAARYALEHAPSPPTCAAIEHMFDKLKRQQQVVSGKALHLISQQRDKCDKEFAEIQKIRTELDTTLTTCKEAREHLNTAKEDLTVSTFVILANYRKRQIIKTVLRHLELLKKLRSVDTEVKQLLNKKEYENAIDLILKSLKSASANKQFVCIKDLTAKLQDTLVMAEERLDNVLATVCYNFDEALFNRLKNAYNLLGKYQSAMDQLHMYYSSAITETSVNALKDYVTENQPDMKFGDMCKYVQVNKAHLCLLMLSENLFFIMKSYYLLVRWHNNRDKSDSKDVLEIEKNVSREYVTQKLQSGLARLWQDVQNKVSTFLKNCPLDEFPFEKFIMTLGVLRKLTQIAEVFCGDKSDLLQDFIKTQSVTYIKNYHRGRMDELKLFLENEGWEQCPVRSNFSLLNLQEFKHFKKYINPKLDISRSQSDGTSSAHSNEDSVYIVKFFSPKSSQTPFEMFRDEKFTNDEIFGLDNDSLTEESDEEPDELNQETLDDVETAKPKQSPAKLKDSIIVTNTTLSVLRNCGQYLQICRYLPQISLEVVMFMNQLFDYYLFTVHLFYTSDLQVSTSTLYSNKLTATLKRISNIIEANSSGDNDAKSFSCPQLPTHLNLTSEESLHGLAERVVAVESVIFLAKQYELLQPYLESIVANHQRLILEHFRENTLVVAKDLRVPIYMCTASKSVDARAALIAMSQVKWDVKEVTLEHSAYVDLIIRQIQVFAMRLDNVSLKVQLNTEVLNAIWSMVSKFIVHLLVEGYSNASKCKAAGRGLMQLDYKQLFVKLEKISGLTSIPYQEYVDKYVKAYYLPRDHFEDFVRERNEYSYKHLSALINVACESKRDRQELIAVLKEKEN